MIEINLLPPEYRPVERTPLPRMAAILVGVLLITSGVAVWLLLIVAAVPKAKLEHGSRKILAQQKEAQAKEVHAIEDELKKFEGRERVLRNLFKERVCWARILDRLAEARAQVSGVVLTNVELKKSAVAGRGPRGGSGDARQLYVKGFAWEPTEGDLSKTYAKFIKVLWQDKKFSDDFEGEPSYLGHRVINLDSGTRMLTPDAKKKKDEADDLPKAGLEFEVLFTFKAPPAAVPETPAPGAPPAPVKH